MDIASKLLDKKVKLAVVGLGYVGLPIAVAFARNGVQVVGFDISSDKIRALKENIDETGECSKDQLKSVSDNISYTDNAESLKQASFIIVAVPTPITIQKTPDLDPIESASKIVGENLKPGSFVVFESTVYPGLTEEVCLPLIEKFSGLKLKDKDFYIGYSPERINPGDKEHRLENIVKIVSGQNETVCKAIGDVYKIVVKAGVFEAKSIKVAEAAKVIENTQRDLNIALMNELSLIFNRMNIDTMSVLEAAGTKWNFLKFYPGLVGGHCIGVDPYYLTSKAEQLGYHPQVVLAGRRINDGMGEFVGQQTIKLMIDAGHSIKGARVLVCGLTFKEQVPDFRNSKVFELIKEFKEYGLDVSVHDPFLNNYYIDRFKLKVADLSNEKFDVVVVASPHKLYKEWGLEGLSQLFVDVAKGVLIDIRWLLDKESAGQFKGKYWRL